MKKNKKGFSLVELLVVIAIIGVLLLISFPLINHLVARNNKSKYDAYRDMVEEATKIYMDELGFKISGCYSLSASELQAQGLLSNFSEQDLDADVFIYTDEEGNIDDIKINIYDESLEDPSTCNESGFGECEIVDWNEILACKYEIVQDQSAYGQNADFSGANAPRLKEKMIPVKYDGENWVVADVNNYKYSYVFEEDYSWYNYNDGYWANAIYVKEDAYSKYVTNGEFTMQKIVSEDDVLSWWVWIPRFAYKRDNRDYLIEFLKDTDSNVSSGYQIAEAFVDPDYNSDATNEELDKKYSEDYGFWVGKYELGKEGDTYVVKQQDDASNYLTKQTATEFINAGTQITGAHTIRNKEWNTVTLLSLSKYGSEDSSSEYTTDNNSGVYNMASNVEFTAGNLRGLTNFNIKVTCENSCNDNGESVVTAEETTVNTSGSTSGWLFRPYDKKNYCNPNAYDKNTAVTACLLIVMDGGIPTLITDNDVDIYNMNYHWYASGSILDSYTCDTNFCVYGPNGSTIKSPNKVDSDAFLTYSSFRSGYPRFSLTYNDDGTWTRKTTAVSGQVTNAYLWTFRGNNNISSTSYYDDITIDYDEMMEKLNNTCQPQLTCTEEDKKTTTKTVYQSSYTEYDARTRVVIR